jgi:hypothetical protein
MFSEMELKRRARKAKKKATADLRGMNRLRKTVRAS